jgi:homoserine kinase type II
MAEGSGFSENSGQSFEMPGWRGVLDAYRPAYLPKDCQVWGTAGGFSGALVWRLDTAAGEFCLRRWPVEHPDFKRLTWIHAVLRHVFAQGFRQVAVPVLTQLGASWVDHRGHLWELSPWLPGVADYRSAPSPNKLAAAMRALARFHRAAESFVQAGTAATGPSPGIATRQERLRHWQRGGLAKLRAAITPGDWPELADCAQGLCGLFCNAAPAVETTLAGLPQLQVPLQPCLRDIWHEHVLFVGDQVTGLIDYGAMRIETVATDVARLLGSLVADDAADWQAGLVAYQSVRPLSNDEQRLVRAFDAANVLLGGLEWLDWIYLQGRVFADRHAVEDRIDEFLLRLGRLVDAAR